MNFGYYLNNATFEHLILIILFISFIIVYSSKNITNINKYKKKYKKKINDEFNEVKKYKEKINNENYERDERNKRNENFIIHSDIDTDDTNDIDEKKKNYMQSILKKIKKKKIKVMQKRKQKNQTQTPTPT